MASSTISTGTSMAVLLCIFILNALTLVLLSAMLLTICLSEGAKRSPMFKNFILVTVIYSAFLFYSDMTMLSPNSKQQMPVVKLQQSCLTLIISITSVASCSYYEPYDSSHLDIYSLQVGLVMRNAFQKISPKVQKRIEIFFIASPYVVGIVPLGDLFITSNQFTNGVNYFQAAASVVATFFDVFLLFKFHQYRQRLKQYEVEPDSILTKSTLIRMTLVCVFRIIITIFGLLSDIWDVRADADPTSSLVHLQDNQLQILSLPCVYSFNE
ncbi:hypothetical protein Clacol_009412 [Clathrus columnatus]|uniref:Uncharacterized protein n=1 Tax=Clathrus columnatus TaxID=1419009 RepID=A0AAV5AKE6_9AGAM|nr:hypothetical protein Clacol_009412 [Clathrus columnatus]